VTGASYFIAGTDTGVGKTRVTTALLAAGRLAGLRAMGMKPIAAGAESLDGRLVSADAQAIASASGQTTDYSDLNPYCLKEPISPHIAAKFGNITVDIDLIVTISRKLRGQSDLLLIEGAGGWYTPIRDDKSMADLVVALQVPVLLVVGLKLGCLNHARLTREAIDHCGCRFAGWIGSHVDPDYAALAENLLTLNQLLGAPPLGLLRFARSSDGDALQLRGALARLRESPPSNHLSR